MSTDLMHSPTTACFPPPEEFLFEDPKSYTYLTNGNLSVPGLNDMNEYEDTREAMNIMGMSEEEQSGKGEGAVREGDEWKEGQRERRREGGGRGEGAEREKWCAN